MIPRIGARQRSENPAQYLGLHPDAIIARTADFALVLASGGPFKGTPREWGIRQRRDRGWPGDGGPVGPVTVELARVRACKDAVVLTARGNVTRWMENTAGMRGSSTRPVTGSA